MSNAMPVEFGGFVKYEHKQKPPDNRSRKSTPFDRHGIKPWYLGKLRYKGYWRSQGYAQRGWSQYSTSLAALSSYLRAYGRDKHRGIFIDAGCGDSPDALLAVKELGYDKAYKIDLFEPTFDEYGVAKLYYSESPIRGTIESMEKNHSIQFMKGDLCEPLPIGDNSISAVSCNAVVDLIKEEDKTLFYKQMYRILKPGGLLAVCFVPLAAGYGSSGYFEHDICTMPGWNVGLESITRSSSTFIVRKPRFTRDSRGRFARGVSKS